MLNRSPSRLYSPTLQLMGIVNSLYSYMENNVLLLLLLFFFLK